ncbi:MAG: MFS transporter [Ignavibacteriales bacterium]|nr:MFS transporter [Ignavibacteriales bacterium]
MTQKIFEFLGLKRSTIALLIMVVLVGMGEKLAERFLPIYLLALGGGILSIGYFNGANNFLNAVYSFAGGYISDRLGYKRALFLFNLLAIFGYLIVIIFPVWQMVIVGSLFFLSWSAISMPATMDLVAKNLPQQKRTMGVSVNSFVRRIPMIIGPIIGGVLISTFGETRGVQFAFGLAIVFTVAALIFQQRMIEGTAGTKNVVGNPFVLWKQMSSDLKHLLLSDVLIRFCEQIPYAFVVVWCMKTIGISAWEFGVLTAVEMTTAMFVYIPVAHFADKTGKKIFVTITFWFFTFFPLVLFFSTSYILLLLAFILRGLKEFGEPTRKALILDLSPDQSKASMYGLYYLVRDVIVSVAAFVGAYLWEVSPAMNLLSAFAFGIIGSVYFMVAGKDVLPQTANLKTQT